jgi:hypothetical protein
MDDGRLRTIENVLSRIRISKKENIRLHDGIFVVNYKCVRKYLDIVR